ncbi:MAG: sensor histidine kinase, partial [Butyrivibrio sp.]|nr:sensor histidine kinase [Butyrivibrio sp.]
MCIILVVVLLLITGTVLLFARKKSGEFLNLYKIEINRVENELRELADAGKSIEVNDADGEVDFDLGRYDTITGVFLRTSENSDSFFNAGNDYHIADIDGDLYRIEYRVDLSKEREGFFRSSLVVVAVVVCTLILFLIYIYNSIIRTFNKISEYPAQLSKGNLSIPLAEEKNKYFGRFLWGLDMLREKLEEEKRRNLELQKEKNVFLLSLSHDMKTPISAIKLYAAALRKNLYRDEEKLREVGDKIENNAEEIEKYVARIISSSGDEFLDLSVKEEEFYLAEAVNPIREYYADKLKPLGTDFTIDSYSDVLVRGDKDRL